MACHPTHDPAAPHPFGEWCPLPAPDRLHQHNGSQRRRAHPSSATRGDATGLALRCARATPSEDEAPLRHMTYGGRRPADGTVDPVYLGTPHRTRRSCPGSPCSYSHSSLAPPPHVRPRRRRIPRAPSWSTPWPCLRSASPTGPWSTARSSRRTGTRWCCARSQAHDSSCDRTRFAASAQPPAAWYAASIGPKTPITRACCFRAPGARSVPVRATLPRTSCSFPWWPTVSRIASRSPVARP
jgi:hypothetical protein